MNLAALDCRIASEGSPNGLGKSLRTVNDEKTRHARVETTLDEIVDERLHRRRIFRRTLDEAERVLVALFVDAERRHEEHVFVHVNTVDLDHKEIEIVEPAFHPFFHASRPQPFSK